jgi:hypothetical protein
VTDPRVGDVLAAAHAEIGTFTEAVRIARLAADQADKLGQRGLAKQIRERALLYSRKECYRLDR